MCLPLFLVSSWGVALLASEVLGLTVLSLVLRVSLLLDPPIPPLPPNLEVSMWGIS
jgi:hypothetical protein